MAETHKWTGYIYLICGFLSMLSGLCLLFIYLRTKSFLETPGMLIFWHILSQICIDAAIAFTGLYRILIGEFPDDLCMELGVFNTYFYILGFNYSLCLCTEVIKKMKKPMDNNYKKRSRIYHLTSHIVGLALCLIISISQEAGVSSNHLCMITQSSRYIYIIVLPLVFYIPALFFTFYITCRMNSRTSSTSFFLAKHSIYVTVYFSIWCPVILNILLRKDFYDSDDNIFSRVSVFASSSAGFILCVVRVIMYYVIKHIKLTQRHSSKSNLSIIGLINESIKANPEAALLEDSLTYKSDYVNIFSSVSTESAITSVLIFQLSLQYTEIAGLPGLTGSTKNGTRQQLPQNKCIC